MHVHSHEHEQGSPLDFTGERVIPDDPAWAWCFQAHLFGYEDLMRRIESGGIVLDIGSGEGYGPAALARHARAVVAGDVSFEATSHARGRYGAAGVHWCAFDATRLPFKSGAFDSVSSLQVIEHFSDTDAHLDEVARVLKPGALHYVTTPNIDKMGEAERDNPYHLRDFDAKDLRSCLEQRFTGVELEGMFYVNDSPRVRAMRIAEAQEELMRPKLRRVEERLAKLPGAVRARVRQFVRRMAGIKSWPMPEAERARNAIVSADFYAGAPAEDSFCLIGVARKPATRTPAKKRDPRRAGAKATTRSRAPRSARTRQPRAR